MKRQHARDIVASAIYPPFDATRGFFLSGENGSGRIFCAHHSPAAKFQVIAAPPFAEEMNKSRRMFTLLGNALKSRGYGVLIPDLYGTGDSAGDFADARWEIWKQNLAHAYRYLENQGAATVALLGLRLGALLATECIREELLAVDRLVLWQPVVNGNAYLTQFLRLRLAADIAAENKETTKHLREKLAAGEALEIAGYTLAPALASAIDAANMRELVPNNSLTVHWMEISSGASLAPPSRAVVDRWRGKTPCIETVVAGPPFWTTAEITVAPELIERTLAVFD
jgi:exosortase A-associated hydrolase 2